MKHVSLLAVAALSSLVLTAEPWTSERLGRLLSDSGRFVETDYASESDEDVPNRQRNSLPLFVDVLQESGWSTNQLIDALITVSSNGLSAAGWADSQRRNGAIAAIRLLSDINHPAVTNYFHGIVSSDLHGLEEVVIPATFKYTNLEPEVLQTMKRWCVQTNRYDKAAPMVALDLLDCLKSLPEACKADARIRVANYIYFSSRHISSSQTWQDEQLAKLVPEYSNSVQRLNQMRYFAASSTNDYERSRSIAQIGRLIAMPTNSLNNVSWMEAWR